VKVSVTLSKDDDNVKHTVVSNKTSYKQDNQQSNDDGTDQANHQPIATSSLQFRRYQQTTERQHIAHHNRNTFRNTFIKLSRTVQQKNAQTVEFRIIAKYQQLICLMHYEINYNLCINDAQHSS